MKKDYDPILGDLSDLTYSDLLSLKQEAEETEPELVDRVDAAISRREDSAYEER